MTKNYGWINSAWQKDPLRLGYSGNKSQSIQDLSASAGTNGLFSDFVPYYELWDVQCIFIYNWTSACTGLFLSAYTGGGTYNIRLAHILNPAQGYTLVWTGSLLLDENCFIYLVATGCTAGDDLYGGFTAVRIDIDQ